MGRETKCKFKRNLIWEEKRDHRKNNKICQFDCGEGGYVEVHHILPYKVAPQKVTDMNNGITLCRPCHMKTMGKELELARTYFALVQVQL